VRADDDVRAADGEPVGPHREWRVDELRRLALLEDAAACALVIATSGCDQSPFGPSETEVTFSGRVLDYATQVPLCGAVVRFAVDVFTPQAPFTEAATGSDGRYTLTVPRTGIFNVLIDGAFAGTTRVNGGLFRGDLFRRSGNCISRYGHIIDSKTLAPVRDATVRLSGGTTTTGADGWYRLDLGCPDVVLPGGTTFLTVTHRDYEDRSQVVGRGVQGVQRLDLDLTKR